MNIQRLLVSSCVIAAVLGATTVAAHATATKASSTKNVGDDKQKPKPPDKPKPKAPDKPKTPPKADKPADKPKEARKPATVGSEIDSAMSLTDIDAKAHKMADLRGKVVVIEFWSAHSPDSSGYDKRLADIQTAAAAKGVVFIGIDADKSDFDPTVKDPAGTLKEALKTRGLEGKMPLVLDKDGSLTTQLGGKAAPYALVIDAKGVVRYSGPVDEDIKTDRKDAKHYLSDAIEAATAVKPAPAGGDGKEPPKK